MDEIAAVENHNTVSRQLSADRSQLAGQKANLESLVEHLEDAVALFNPAGELLFTNPAMQATVTPEPATIFLMATGLAGLAPVARRRRRKGA